MARVCRIIVYVLLVALCACMFVMSGSVFALIACLAALLLPLIGWALVALAARGLEIGLACKSSVPKGQPLQVELNARCSSRLPIPHLWVRLHVKNLLTEQESVQDISFAAVRSRQTHIAMDLQSELCGRIVMSVESLRAFEAFRIFSCKLDSNPRRRLSVMPTLFAAGMRDIYAASPLSDTTVFSPYKRGSDLSEVFALREYEPGDEVKRIHWKLSAKIGDLIVRDASLPLDNSIMVFFDKGLYGQARDMRRADAMAEVVLAVCEQLASAGVPFEIATNDTVQNTCLRSFITAEGDIYEMIGQLMSCPLSPCASSGIELYTRQFSTPACSRLIYVCAGYPAGIETLARDKDLLVLVCDDGAGLESTPAGQVIHFPAQSPQLAIELLGVV